jgi:NifU-like protein
MSSEARRRLVCRCLGVASSSVFAAVRAGRLVTVLDVTKAVRAGGACGLCHPELEEILAELRGEPIDPALAIENELACRSETAARVEGVVLGAIAPSIAPLGARVAGVDVDGLSVRVRLSGSRDAAVCRIVEEQLRRGVCADLEIEVG